MTKINSSIPGNTSITEWMERNQRQIETHPAWYKNISEVESENLLKDKAPFTYLLRSGKEQPYSYFISFVKEDFSIKHQFFVLELVKKGWQYRNGATSSPQENVNDLIPMMMHCDRNSCIPLKFK